MQVKVLSLLNTDALCTAAGFCKTLSVLATDASLWQTRQLTLGVWPYPPLPPRALHTLIVSATHLRTPQHAQSVLAWLACGAGSDGTLPLRCLLLDGQLPDETVSAAIRLCGGLRQLCLRNLAVQSSWLPALAVALRTVRTVRLYQPVVSSLESE